MNLQTNALQKPSLASALLKQNELWVGLSALNIDGCKVTDSVIVVYRELPIIIPNPQTIQKGNTFQIINLPDNSNVYLYDALGKIVFDIQNYHTGNNAPLVDLEVAGIYYYMIVMPDEQIQKGKVNLLR